VAYTKHAEVSLEEMTIDNVVVTDIPTPALLHGTVPTSVGHNLNREILRLRSDINAVIHVHHDETIAFFAAGGAKNLRVLWRPMWAPSPTSSGTPTRSSWVHDLAQDSVDWMYRHAESVIYPSRDATRQPAGGDRLA